MKKYRIVQRCYLGSYSVEDKEVSSSANSYRWETTGESFDDLGGAVDYVKNRLVWDKEEAEWKAKYGETRVIGEYDQTHPPF